jgi:NAD(P)-dependent dehydrogenase (short-subunit alcohol dehydrogenase family)
VNRLENRVALITGAATGIGRNITQRFVHEGARVVIADINRSEGASLADRLGEHTHFEYLDVSHDESWRCALQGAQQKFGVLNILVNNAGVTLPGNVETIALDAWQRTLDVDLTGVFLGCRHGIAAMKEGGGAIINISSAYGLKADPETVAYNAAKSAIVLMSKSIALHCARGGYDITCNVVHPGVIRTPMMEAYISACDDPAAEADKWRRMHPIGRLGTPAEIAAMVAFLASSEARFCTGASFVVDGGISL